MSEKTKAIGLRFLKAFVSGAASIAGTATLVNVQGWGDLKTALSTLMLALIIGGINGVLMAGEKWWNWTEPTV